MLKEKEKLYYWVYKAFVRKKAGMMFLAVVSTAVFVWIMFVGTGQDASGRGDPLSIKISNNTAHNRNESLPANAVQEPFQAIPRRYFTDVPEGCVIIREHVPISNLFGCLWFNEVDRFTSRDRQHVLGL